MHEVKKQVIIHAPIEVVWEYLTSRELLAEWFMDNDFVAKTGARFTFTGDATENWDGVIYCEVTEFNAPHILAFNWNANDIQGETLVRIELKSEESGTLLTLVHSGFDNVRLPLAPIVERHQGGWDYFLPKLQSRFEK